jgi:hypothetical protein
MTFIYGFLGAILALGVFATGVICGWRLNEKMREKKAVIAEQQVGEEERRRLKAEQDAFRQLINYNTSVAYGPDLSEYMNPEESEATS